MRSPHVSALEGGIPEHGILRTLDERRSELCVKTLEKISRGGPLVKHLPMTRQRMHNYQTRCAD